MLKLIALLVAYAAIATRLMFAIGTPGRRFALSTSTVERRLAAKSRPRQSLLTVLSVSLAIVLAIPFNAIAAVAPGRLLGRTADGAASRYAYDSSPTVLQRREPTALNTLCPEDVRGHLAATRASLSATRGVGAAAPKVLSAIPARITNAANHIFGSNLAKHKLGGVLGAFEGDATAATYALENATQVLANQGAISGFFKGTVVEVAGFAVTVQGRVINGVAHLSTAFIP